MPILDITGDVFGELTVLGLGPRLPSPSTRSPRRTMMQWHVRCSCGEERFVRSQNLTTGRTRSCGHLRQQRQLITDTDRPFHLTAEYIAWNNYRNFYRNPNSHAYPDYGGRGRVFAKAWDDFNRFLNDVGYRPHSSYTLQLIDKNKSFVPGNVKWGTAVEAHRSARTAHLLTWNGRTMCMAEWSRVIGVHPETFRQRLTKWGECARLFRVETPEVKKENAYKRTPEHQRKMNATKRRIAAEKRRLKQVA